MSRLAKASSIAAAIIVSCFAVLLAYVITFADEAQADETTLTRHAMPTTEPSLVTDVDKLTGENWMSGVSGSLFLHEINIPGTHDS